LGAGQHPRIPSLRVGLDEADVREIDSNSIHPCVQRQAGDNHPFTLTDVLRTRDEVMRATSTHVHRHLTIGVTHRDSIWKDQPSDAVADDVPDETGVVGRTRLDRVYAVEVAKQGARNRRRPDIRANVDHGAPDGQLACLENLGERQTTPYAEAMFNPFG